MERSGYTIRIFVADGDPEGVRIIDQMNWTGAGIVFPRVLWPKIKMRKEFERAGVYILIGHGEDDDDDLPRIYVGEGDGIRQRIDKHDGTKDFWSWAVAFTSNAGALNKAHVQWLEHRLIQRAAEAGQCTIDNGNIPQAPFLLEHEQADIGGFFDQMLRILPLVNLRAFEKPKPVVVSIHGALSPSPRPAAADDTIIVPAQRDGFERVFLREHAWYAIRISGAKLEKIKYCAAYQTSPVSAVTHVATVKQIEPYGDSGKYRLVFAEAARMIGPVPLGNATAGTMQGPRYTSYAKLAVARSVSDLF